MNKYLKPIYSAIILCFAISLIFGGRSVLAQSNYDPPTLLPGQDVDIGGTGGACMGLATMIQTGNIHLRNLPCFVKFFTQTLVGVAGSLAVIFVMIGGYRYVVDSDENKDKAKKTITYALIGLAISLLAWVIIDLVLQIATE